MQLEKYTEGRETSRRKKITGGLHEPPFPSDMVLSFIFKAFLFLLFSLLLLRSNPSLVEVSSMLLFPSLVHGR